MNQMSGWKQGMRKKERQESKGISINMGTTEKGLTMKDHIRTYRRDGRDPITFGFL